MRKKRIRNKICGMKEWKFIGNLKSSIARFSSIRALGKSFRINSAINIIYRWNFDLLNLLIGATMLLQAFFVFTSESHNINTQVLHRHVGLANPLLCFHPYILSESFYVSVFVSALSFSIIYMYIYIYILYIYILHI